MRRAIGPGIAGPGLGSCFAMGSAVVLAAVAALLPTPVTVVAAILPVLAGAAGSRLVFGPDRSGVARPALYLRALVSIIFAVMSLLAGVLLVQASGRSITLRSTVISVAALTLAMVVAGRIEVVRSSPVRLRVGSGRTMSPTSVSADPSLQPLRVVLIATAITAVVLWFGAVALNTGQGGPLLGSPFVFFIPPLAGCAGVAVAWFTLGPGDLGARNAAAAEDLPFAVLISVSMTALAPAVAALGVAVQGRELTGSRVAVALVVLDLVLLAAHGGGTWLRLQRRRAELGLSRDKLWPRAWRSAVGVALSVALLTGALAAARAMQVSPAEDLTLFELSGVAATSADPTIVTRGSTVEIPVAVRGRTAAGTRTEPETSVLVDGRSAQGLSSQWVTETGSPTKDGPELNGTLTFRAPRDVGLHQIVITVVLGPASKDRLKLTTTVLVRE